VVAGTPRNLGPLPDASEPLQHHLGLEVRCSRFSSGQRATSHGSILPCPIFGKHYTPSIQLRCKGML
jgi:hypothetical protein